MLAERFLTRRFDQIATSAASSTVGACADLAALEAAMSEKDPSVKPLSRRILDLQSHDGTEGAAALELMPNGGPDRADRPHPYSFHFAGSERTSFLGNKNPFYPEEITKFTGEPCVMELPLAGSWLITLPVTTVLLLCWVTVPTVSLASVSAAVAAS
jgi:hypothetical protein